MSPQESQLFWCVLEGNPEPYVVFDKPIVVNVNQLKASIQQRVPILRGIDYDRLELWKVVSPKFQGHVLSDSLFQLNVVVPVNPVDSLTQQLGALGDITTCLRKLSVGEKVGVLFPEPHSEDNLHIVVQC